MEHPLSKISDLTIDHLANQRIIIYNKTFLTTKIIEEYLARKGLNGYKTVEINNIGWIKMMVRKGLGIAIFRKTIVSEEIKSKKLVQLSVLEDIPQTPISLLINNSIPDDIKMTILKAVKEMF